MFYNYIYSLNKQYIDIYNMFKKPQTFKKDDQSCLCINGASGESFISYEHRHMKKKHTSELLFLKG